jgi:hypothetical protein
MVNASDLIDNPIVKWAIIAGVLTILAGITFFAAVETGINDAVTLIASLFGLVVILYLFGSKGPLHGN